MKTDRLRRAVYCIIWIVVAVVLFTIVFIENGILYKGFLNDEEWGKMEKQALSIAKSAVYDINGFREIEEAEENEINYTFSVTQEEIKINIVDGYNNVTAKYPIISSETYPTQENGVVRKVTTYDYANGDYTRYRTDGTWTLRYDKMWQDIVKYIFITIIAASFIGGIVVAVFYIVIEEIPWDEFGRKMKKLLRKLKQQIVCVWKKALKFICNIPKRIIQWIQETTER